MSTAYISLGSNIEPEKHFCASLRKMEQDFPGLRLSSIYRTPAIGFEGDDFLNTVAAITTTQSLTDIWQYLKHLEHEHGRTRNAEKFSARTLDADLILFDQVLLQPYLNLPHQDIVKYAYVLHPLQELAPHATHPEFGINIQQLAKRLQLCRKALQPTQLPCLN